VELDIFLAGAEILEPPMLDHPPNDIVAPIKKILEANGTIRQFNLFLLLSFCTPSRALKKISREKLRLIIVTQQITAWSAASQLLGMPGHDAVPAPAKCQKKYHYDTKKKHMF